MSSTVNMPVNMPQDSQQDQMSQEKEESMPQMMTWMTAFSWIFGIVAIGLSIYCLVALGHGEATFEGDVFEQNTVKCASLDASDTVSTDKLGAKQIVLGGTPVMGGTPMPDQPIDSKWVAKVNEAIESLQQNADSVGGTDSSEQTPGSSEQTTDSSEQTVVVRTTVEGVSVSQAREQLARFKLVSEEVYQDYKLEKELLLPYYALPFSDAFNSADGTSSFAATFMLKEKSRLDKEYKTALFCERGSETKSEVVSFELQQYCRDVAKNFMDRKSAVLYDYADADQWQIAKDEMDIYQIECSLHSSLSRYLNSLDYTDSKAAQTKLCELLWEISLDGSDGVSVVPFFPNGSKIQFFCDCPQRNKEDFSDDGDALKSERRYSSSLRIFGRFEFPDARVYDEKGKTVDKADEPRFGQKMTHNAALVFPCSFSAPGYLSDSFESQAYRVMYPSQPFSSKVNWQDADLAAATRVTLDAWD